MQGKKYKTTLNTGASAARLYWENAKIVYNGQVSIPAAFTVFPGELYRAPKTWVEYTFPNLPII
jgi:hypothetical protein